jgi:peptidase E
MAERHIVGLGGAGDTQEQTDRLYEYVLGLTGKERPRVLFIPTASAEDAEYVVWFYERFARRAEASHLNTFPWSPENLRELIETGFPEGVAADDGVGVHYVGTEIAEVVTCRPGAAAYRVTRDGEEKLETRELR